MNKTLHAPTPWKVYWDPDPWVTRVGDAAQAILVIPEGIRARAVDKANAEFIVCACNAYDALVAVAEHAVSYWGFMATDDPDDPATIEAAVEAIIDSGDFVGYMRQARHEDRGPHPHLRRAAMLSNMLW